MKAIGVIVLILVLLVAGVGGYLFFYSGDLIKQGVEEFGPEYLGADVSVGSVNIDYVGGRGEIRNLVIGNPDGFSGPPAMSLNRVGITLDVQNLSSDLVVIKEVLVDGASVAAIAQGKKTNFQKLMDNLEANAGTSETAPAQTDAASETKFIIDKFSFTNADVSLNSDLLGQKDMSIPPIELSGIGRKTNGATAIEVGEQLLKPITTAISRAAVSQGLELEGVKANLLEKVRDKVPGVDKISDFLNR